MSVETAQTKKAARPRIVVASEYPLGYGGGVSVLVRELLRGLAERYEFVLVSPDSEAELEQAGAMSWLAGHMPWEKGKMTAERAREFAARVEARLDRSWAFRRLAITVAGLVGGAIAAMQMIGSRLGAQVEGVGSQASAQIARSWNEVSAPLKAISVLPYSTEVMWMGAGLAVLAIALIATRSIEEL